MTLLKEWKAKLQIGREYLQIIYDREHIKNSQNSNNKTNNSIKNWAKYWVESWQKNLRIAIKHTKRCSEELVIRKMQIKIIIVCNYISIRITKVKKSYRTKCWQGCEKTGTL